MGEHDVLAWGAATVRAFQAALLEDLEVLESMLPTAMFDSAGTRIGAEQEMFLIDAHGRPAPVAMEVLAQLTDPRLVTELARFNLEANLTPRPFRGSCLADLESELREVIDLASTASATVGAQVLLTGILPSVTRDHLGLHNMTPTPRYSALSATMAQHRGQQFRIHIQGIDELELEHPTVMLESANTSFQLHWQVAPADFARCYNIAQVISGPVLAAAVNSPLLLGRQLWDETRIALFQQAVEPRHVAHRTRELPPRVGFGERWVQHSVVEMFRENIEDHRVLVTAPADTLSSAAILRQGNVPPLVALRLHNGTIYRWNRPCYGTDGRFAHLRIEFRALPAGPTISDEMANAALLFGLMARGTSAWDDPKHALPFQRVKEGFFAAARHGLHAHLPWLDGQTYGARDLLLDVLLPEAQIGLTDAGIPAHETQRLLGIIAGRVQYGQTGAEWTRRCWASLDGCQPRSARLHSIVRAMAHNAKDDTPVYLWPSGVPDHPPLPEDMLTIDQIMTTRLFTVCREDLIELVESLMRWEHVRHVPVEDNSGTFVGLITQAALLHAVAEQGGSQVAVGDILEPWPATATRELKLLDAMALLRTHNLSALPVLDDGVLVGLVTERDLLRAAESLLRANMLDAQPEHA